MIALLVLIIGLLLAALAFGVSATALRVKNVRKARRWRRLEARWEPLLAEVLSGLSKPAALLAAVEKGEELYFVDFLYRQARVRVGEEREILSGMARPHLGPIVERMKKGDAERRARAVQTVSVLGFPAYADRLLEALDDPSPLVATIAARALARARKAEYAAAVISRLDRFEDTSARFLTSTLVSMGDVAAPALREALTGTERTARIRAVCADALRQLNDAQAADVAAAVLARETDSDVVAACLRLLRKLGSPEHVPAIRPLVESPDLAIRAQAVGAIGRLGGPGDTDLLRFALNDPSAWVVMHAARALRERGQAHLLRSLAATQHPHTDIALQVLAE